MSLKWIEGQLLQSEVPGCAIHEVCLQKTAVEEKKVAGVLREMLVVAVLELAYKFGRGKRQSL